MKQHDDDKDVLQRISTTCKPCLKPVGGTWIKLGDVLSGIIADLADMVAARGREERSDDDAKTS